MKRKSKSKPVKTFEGTSEGAKKGWETRRAGGAGATPEAAPLSPETAATVAKADKIVERAKAQGITTQPGEAAGMPKQPPAPPASPAQAKPKGSITPAHHERARGLGRMAGMGRMGGGGLFHKKKDEKKKKGQPQHEGMAKFVAVMEAVQKGFAHKMPAAVQPAKPPSEPPASPPKAQPKDRFAQQLEALAVANRAYGQDTGGFVHYVPSVKQGTKPDSWKTMNREIGAMEQRANTLLAFKDEEFPDPCSRHSLHAAAAQLRGQAAELAKKRDLTSCPKEVKP